MRRGLVVLVLAVLFVIGSIVAASRPSADVGTLTIVSPEQGAVVHAEYVVIEGTAPPGAEIVWDIRWSPDERTWAADDGTWSMTVPLLPGDNAFRLRIGDFKDTARTLVVTYAGSDVAACIWPCRAASDTAIGDAFRLVLVTPGSEFSPGRASVVAMLTYAGTRSRLPFGYTEQVVTFGARRAGDPPGGPVAREVCQVGTASQDVAVRYQGFVDLDADTVEIWAAVALRPGGCGAVDTVELLATVPVDVHE